VFQLVTSGSSNAFFLVVISTEDYRAGAVYFMFPCVLHLLLHILVCYGARHGANVCSPYLISAGGNTPQKDFTNSYKFLMVVDPKVRAAPV